MSMRLLGCERLDRGSRGRNENRTESCSPRQNCSARASESVKKTWLASFHQSPLSKENGFPKPFARRAISPFQSPLAPACARHALADWLWAYVQFFHCLCVTWALPSVWLLRTHPTFLRRCFDTLSSPPPRAGLPVVCDPAMSHQSAHTDVDFAIERLVQLSLREDGAASAAFGAPPQAEQLAAAAAARSAHHAVLSQLMQLQQRNAELEAKLAHTLRENEQLRRASSEMDRQLRQASDKLYQQGGLIVAQEEQLKLLQRKNYALSVHIAHYDRPGEGVMH